MNYRKRVFNNNNINGAVPQAMKYLIFPLINLYNLLIFLSKLLLFSQVEQYRTH